MKQLRKPIKDQKTNNFVKGYVECPETYDADGGSTWCSSGYSKDCGLFSRSSVADDEEIIF